MNNKCICIALRDASQSSTAFYDAVLGPSGLKVTMYRLLRRISEDSDISLSGLAAVTGLDRSTLGRNLRVLEKQGLVRIGTGQDERARALRLTDAGEAALAEAVPLWEIAQKAMKAEVGADLETLLSALGKLSDFASKRKDQNA